MTEEPGLVRLEDQLRAAFGADRPLLGAPPGLRQRILDVPTANRRFALGGGWAALGASAVAAAACVAAWLVATRQSPLSDAGSGPMASPVPWDPTLSVGVISGVLPTLLVVPGSIALAAGFLAVRWMFRWWRQRRLGLLLPAVAWAVIGAAAVALATQPGFVHGSFHGAVQGVDVRVDAAPGSSGSVDTWYITARPGEPFAVALSITNPGPLPIRFEGLVEDLPARDTVSYRWTSVWLSSDPNSYGFKDHAVPFRPTVVEPGQEMPIFLVGRAGTCAFGRAFDPAAPPANLPGYGGRGRDVRLAYSVLGLESTTELALRFELVQPQVSPCLP